MNYVIQGQTLTGIADAIRAQLGTEQQYTPESMAAAIGSIQGGTTEVESLINGSISGDFTFNVTILKQHAISYTNNPLTLRFPACTEIRANGIYSDTGLKWVCLDLVEKIGDVAFAADTALVAVVIKSGVVPTLGSRAFTATPIDSGIGFIYVPDDLVEQYKVATNWATYASQIKGLSELPAEVQEWLDQQGGAAT